MNDLPQMLSTTYASSTLDPDLMFRGQGVAFPGGNADLVDAARRMAIAGHMANKLGGVPTPDIRNQLIKENQMATRIVRVIIADPNENIPLDQRVLFMSNEMTTDMTDEELYFDVNPAAKLAAHNEKRVKMLDKKASDRANKEVFLEPARIRDLKMIVVNIATF